eukprot:m.39733 g.39733  ORF g.39733 m.39733 type:complete len:326 (+) comp11306_c0_seq2:134-1111(+)
MADQPLTFAVHAEAANDVQVWKTVTGATVSEEGSAGVFILETPKGKVVIKTGTTVAQELFASLLAKELLSGLVALPQIRIVSFNQDEFAAIKDRLYALTVKSQHRIKVERELKRPFYMVMEFAEGRPLAGQGLDDVVHDCDFAKQLGHLIAFDMFINNWDRFPAIWENEGNFMNALVQPGTGCAHRLVGIDQAITAISPSAHATGFEKYASKVTTLLEALLLAPKEPCTQLNKLCEAFQMWTGLEIKGDLGSIQLGILEGVSSIAAAVTPAAVRAVRDKAQSSAAADWEDVWQRMMDLIRLEFLDAMIELFVSFKPRIDDVLQKQ